MMMKKIFFLCMAIATMALTSCSDNADNPLMVVDDMPFPYGSEIDESIRPGDDFYKYALGQWLNSSDPSPSLFTQIQNETKELFRKMLETSNDPVMVTLRSQVDQTLKDDSKNKALLGERLQTLEQVTTADQMYSAFANLQSLGYSPLFRLVPYAMDGKRCVNIICTGGMPNEIMPYIARGQKQQLDSIITAYCSQLSNFGFSQERIEQITEHAIYMENIEMSAYNPYLEMLRHPQEMTFTRRAPSQEELQLRIVMKMMGFTDKDFVDYTWILSNEAIETLMLQFADIVEQPDIDLLRDYMIYNVLAQDLPFVPSIKKNVTRNGMMNSALLYNKYYKYRLLTESYGYDNICKQQCQDIMEQMRQNFIRRVNKLDWMGDATKAEACKKAEAMKFYIGYPDRWNDELTPQLQGDFLLATVTELRQNAVQTISSLRGKSTDECGWDMWAGMAQFTTDNAFYMTSTNSLVILPAWITKPRFNNDLSDATVYAVTTTFGHEFCHGFDANGAKYDENGNWRNWWQPADQEAFEAKQQFMIDLYNQMEVIPGLMADGQNTLGENMADYGGQELALECYKQRLIQLGFEGAQFDKQIKKFFLSYAQVWKDETELDPALLEYYRDHDNHSAAHNRVNGMMRLQDDWYRLYDIQPTDKLYLAPEDRVKIW